MTVSILVNKLENCFVVYLLEPAMKRCFTEDLYSLGSNVGRVISCCHQAEFPVLMEKKKNLQKDHNVKSVKTNFISCSSRKVNLGQNSEILGLPLCMKIATALNFITSH